MRLVRSGRGGRNLSAAEKSALQVVLGRNATLQELRNHPTHMKKLTKSTKSTSPIPFDTINVRLPPQRECPTDQKAVRFLRKLALTQDDVLIVEDHVQRPDAPHLATALRAADVLSYKYVVARYHYLTSAQTWHANVLIFDVRKRTMTRIDPQGYCTANAKREDDNFTRHFRGRYEIVPLYKSCPYKGPQELDVNTHNNPRGTCLWWTLYYIRLFVIERRIPTISTSRDATNTINRFMRNLAVEPPRRLRKSSSAQGRSASRPNTSHRRA